MSAMSTRSTVYASVVAGFLVLLPVLDAGSQIGAPDDQSRDRAAVTVPTAAVFPDETGQTRTNPEAALAAAIEDEATREKVLAAFAAAILLGAGDTPGLR